MQRKKHEQRTILRQLWLRLSLAATAIFGDLWEAHHAPFSAEWGKLFLMLILLNVRHLMQNRSSENQWQVIDCNFTVYLFVMSTSEVRCWMDVPTRMSLTMRLTFYLKSGKSIFIFYIFFRKWNTLYQLYIKGIFIAVIEKNLVKDTCSLDRNDSPSFDEITSIRSICILATPTGWTTPNIWHYITFHQLPLTALHCCCWEK